MRLILYLGKGGVGKTTVAAATAVRCAERGYKTLVTSTDIAHSLSDVLARPLGSAPVQLADNLWGLEINTLIELRSHWQQLREVLVEEWRGRVRDPLLAQELAVLPGMDEVVGLLQIRSELARPDPFDVMVIDAAPTGETMRLLSAPESFGWYAERLAAESGSLGPFFRTLGLRPSRELLDFLAKVRTGLAELRSILTDPSVSSYRVVLTPEKVVLREALRTLSYLALFGYPCDTVIVNRILPAAESETSPYLHSLRTVQEVQLEAIHSSFAPMPIRHLSWHSGQVVGLPTLSEVGRELWGEDDPTDIFWHGKSMEVEERGEEYVLRLPLAGVEMDKVEMTKRGDQLFIRIGGFHREVVLPQALAERTAAAAQLTTEGVVEIRFPPRS